MIELEYNKRGTAGMGQNGFRADIDALRQVGGAFSDGGRAVAYLVDRLLGVASADTGNGELDGLVARRVSEIERALTGAGQAFEADGSGLLCTANNYTAADIASQCGGER
jgi:hypothetical protein